MAGFLHRLSAQCALRLALLTLPASLREGIGADLQESMSEQADPHSAAALWAMSREVLGVAWHYQAECHRTHASRLQLSALLAGCASLMFLVPPALRTAALGWTSVQPGSSLSAPLLDLVIALCAALSAGLVLGSFAPKQPHLAGSQNLVFAVLVLIAFSHHALPDALCGIAALGAGLWLGQRRRPESWTDPR
jgi:hypothetical protein